MLAEDKAMEVAMAEGADWHFAVGELNKSQLMALSAAERVMREKAELEAQSMKAKVPCECCCFADAHSHNLTLSIVLSHRLRVFQHTGRYKS